MIFFNIQGTNLHRFFDIIHNISGKGKGGIMVFKFIGLLKNGMESDVIKGLI